MADEQHKQGADSVTGPRQPVVKMRRGPSVVWLIPLLTLSIGLWLIAKTISEKGPEITITLHTAEGIEAGKTVIKYKDVKVGMVEKIRFSDSFDHVVLTARLNPEAATFLHRDTRFWVVRPHFSLRGVSGLSTLISGSYLEIDPGHGAVQHHFIGLDEAPIVKSDANGVRITLMAEKLGSLDIGSPVYYQGIQAGEVQGYELANDKHSLFIHVFVRAPYDELVHGNSHFWNISGIDLSMGADGFHLRSSSLRSIIFGGIAFDSRKSADSPDEDASSLVFTLYDDYDEIITKAYTRKLRLVVFFDGSVRGLNVGAPVEFKGIKVGQVTDIRLKFDPTDLSFLIPVIVELEPERIVEGNTSADETAIEVLNSLISRGMRAQLQTGSLLTGKLYVGLDMHPDSPIRLLGNRTTDLPEIPSIAGGLQSIMAKLEKVPLEKIGNDLADLLHGANTLVNGPELKQSMLDMQASLHSFRHVIGKLDGHVEPLAMHLDEALVSGRHALDQAKKTLHTIDQTLDPASPLQYQINQLSRDLSDMARAIRSFVDLLERHPNAVIFGKPTTGEP